MRRRLHRQVRKQKEYAIIEKDRVVAPEKIKLSRDEFIRRMTGNHADAERRTNAVE